MDRSFEREKNEHKAVNILSFSLSLPLTHTPNIYWILLLQIRPFNSFDQLLRMIPRQSMSNVLVNTPHTSYHHHFLKRYAKVTIIRVSFRGGASSRHPLSLSLRTTSKWKLDYTHTQNQMGPLWSREICTCFLSPFFSQLLQEDLQVKECSHWL